MEGKEIQQAKGYDKSWLFSFYSPVLILIIGLVGFALLLIAAELTGTRFYSVVGVHYLRAGEYSNSLYSNITSVLILILFCIVYIEVIGRELNIIRIINAVLISRLPLIFFALFNIQTYIKDLIVINLSKFNHGLYDFLPGDLLVLTIYALIGGMLIIFSVKLLLNGLKVITGKMNKKEVLLFCLMLLAAELMSRLLIQVL